MSKEGGRDWEDYFLNKIPIVFGLALAGALCGLISQIGSESRDELYVKCIYNMRDRTIDQLEMMCAHLRTKP